MEALSTGILINGPGVLDPCEKEPHDALSGLSKQQREDLTVSAQQFLRLIAFRQIFKVIQSLGQIIHWNNYAWKCRNPES